MSDLDTEALKKSRTKRNKLAAEGTPVVHEKVVRKSRHQAQIIEAARRMSPEESYRIIARDNEKKRNGKKKSTAPRRKRVEPTKAEKRLEARRKDFDKMTQRYHGMFHRPGSLK